MQYIPNNVVGINKHDHISLQVQPHKNNIKLENYNQRWNKCNQNPSLK
jgi:hypothetical protein